MRETGFKLIFLPVLHNVGCICELYSLSPCGPMDDVLKYPIFLSTEINSILDNTFFLLRLPWIWVRVVFRYRTYTKILLSVVPGITNLKCHSTFFFNFYRYFHCVIMQCMFTIIYCSVLCTLPMFHREFSSWINLLSEMILLIHTGRASFYNMYIFSQLQNSDF